MLTVVFFFYGLAFFTMGLAVALESRRASALAFGHHLHWLAAFGFLHSLVEWADMFLLIYPTEPVSDVLLIIRTIMLPLSTIVLVRFGIGLVSEAGPLPEWVTFVPVVLLVPLSLLMAYGLTIAVTELPMQTAADVWSRYLLYFPGCLLASFGFLRQWWGLRRAGWERVPGLLLGAALGFLINSIFAGLIVPPAPYGLAPWLNYDRILAITGVPVQVWRGLAALVVAFFVVRALGVFEAERERQLVTLRVERDRSQQKALEAQSKARERVERWMAHMVRISRRIANMEDMNRVLVTIAETARELLGSDTAALALWDESRTQLRLKCYATAEGATVADSTPVRNPIILEAVQTFRPWRFPEDMGDKQDRWICPILNQEILAAAVVPLHLEGQPVGGLWVGRYAYVPFTHDDLLGLEHLADQAVIALEHALMTTRLQSLAVIDERSRLAREMHDSLAQILGYLSLEMQTLEILVRQGNVDLVLAALKKARERIHAAHSDVRESILCLRTTLAGDTGLIPALREYVEGFGVQTGVTTQFITDVEDLHGLSPVAETQLVRIVQEALTNVRKHAQAHHLQVRVMVRDGRLGVVVADDGIGFSPRGDRSHFGLQTMSERAASVGGQLTVTTRPGEGTQVELWLPLAQA